MPIATELERIHLFFGGGVGVSWTLFYQVWIFLLFLRLFKGNTGEYQNSCFLEGSVFCDDEEFFSLILTGKR